jgi:hypothetical protein
MVLMAILGFPAIGQAQVVSLDPNYTVSLFAHGMQLPDSGMIFRPTTNDFLVTSENLGYIYSVNASTGAVSIFADTTKVATSSRPGIVIGFLAIDPAGDVFTALQDFGPILEYDSGGVFLRSFTPTNYRGGALASDSQGNLYVVTQRPGQGGLGGRILRFPSGSFSSPTIYADGFAVAEDIRFNGADQLIVTERSAGNVWRVTPGGMTTSSHTLLASGLPFPDGLAVDPQTQDIFVGGEGLTVTHITAPGAFSTFASGFATSNTAAMGFDTTGNLYVADKFVGVIWKFTRKIASSTLQVQPDHGGNAGTVTVNIIGSGIQNGATVKLMGLGGDIVGSNVTVMNGSNLTATFDLTGAPAGVANVVVTNADGTSNTLAGGFTVEQGGAPQLWVDVVGLNEIRFAHQQMFFITYGNRGNVDGLGVHLTFTFPSTLASTLGFGNEVGVVTTATLGASTVVTVNLGRVPSAATVQLPVFLTASSSQAPFNIQASIRGQ